MISLFLLPVFANGQVRFKGTFICDHYIRWVYSDKLHRDIQHIAAKGIAFTVTLTDDSLKVMPVKGFSQHSYTVDSATVRERDMEDGLRIKEFTYNLKDTRGHKVVMFATFNLSGPDVQFDLFIGNSERTKYSNSSIL